MGKWKSDNKWETAEFKWRPGETPDIAGFMKTRLAALGELEMLGQVIPIVYHETGEGGGTNHLIILIHVFGTSYLCSPTLEEMALPIKKPRKQRTTKAKSKV